MPMPKNGTYWFTCEPPRPPLLLRRIIDEEGIHDDALRGGGVWQPTNLIGAWMAGQEDNVEMVDEERAMSLTSSRTSSPG